MRSSVLVLLALAACDGAGGPPSDNQAPSAPDVTLTPVKPRTLDPLQLQVVTDPVDPDGDDVTLEVIWLADDVPQDDLADALQVGADRTDVDERWAARVTSVDVYGARSDTVTLEVVIDNTPPTVGLSTAALAPPAGSDIVLQVAPHDDDEGDDVTVTVSWTRDGEARPDLDGLMTVPGAGTVRGQVWTARAVPNDGHEDGDPEELDIVIGDGPPVLGSVTIGPASPREADLLTATASATDPEGDAITYEFSWVVDGVHLLGATGPTLDGTWFDKGQEIVAEAVAVSDQGGRSAPLASNAVTARNTPPTLTSAEISPGAGDRSTVFSCTPVGLADVDPADAPVTTVSWLVNGAPVATTPQLSGASFSRGASVTCRLTPDDGTATGVAQTSVAVIIADTPPTLASVTLGPVGATSDSTLIATPSGAADLDGDAVSFRYAWRVNGAPVSGTGSSRVATSFVRGDSVVAEVTPFDGTLTGAPIASAPLVLGNSAPVIQGLVWTPVHANAFEDLSVEATVLDRDGDLPVLHYRWTVNGAAAGTDSPLLTRQAYARGDSVAVTVDADDGHGGADSAQATTTIGDAAPSAPVVTLTPANPDSTDDLTCELVTPSIDPEGDTVGYTFEWTVNGARFFGAAVNGLSSTVLASATLADDDWSCRAVASDGTFSTAGPAAAVWVEPAFCGQNAADDGDANCMCDPGHVWCDTAQFDCCLAPATVFDITVVRAVITTTGANWDSSVLGSAFVPPDVYTDVLVGSLLQGSTTTVDDSYRPTWNAFFGSVTVNPGGYLTLELYDEDLFGSEYIGSFSVSYNSLLSHLDQGQFTLTGSTVTELVLRVDTP